ncbi:F-box domain protein [Ancylostoma caninum]|uniref:F-box domain protein n=1 Tax=Ancylostoma caninum TaxID=29170 RepID=A0A368H453_ANCCA|nr:F-box domain protein [Ancylostoma caninum]
MRKDTGLLFDFDIRTFDEFEFHHWTELPVDVKIKILEYIPFPTLRNFMFLSKESYSLVTRLRTLVFNINFSDMDNFDKVQNFVELAISWPRPGPPTRMKTSKYYILHFVDNGKGGCFAERVIEKKGRKYTCAGVRYNRSPRFVALSTLFHFSTYMDIRETYIGLSALNPEEEHILMAQPTTTLIAKDEFSITTGTSAIVSPFLRFLQPGCRLKIYPLREQGEFFLDTPFFDSAVVHASQAIYFHFNTGATDDQIVLFRGYDITMSVPNVTAKAVNRIILEWLEGKREINVYCLKGLQNVTKTEILRDVEIVPWEKFLTMIYNGDWWGLRFSEGQGTALYNGSRFLIVLVEADLCQLIDPYFTD